MANDEHLKILKSGVEAWNVWRKENSEVTPDLEGADLMGVNLWHAFLGGANLRYANLTGAELEGANFVSTVLRGAILEGAFLGGADLMAANLSGANLLDAKLWDADLEGAKLGGADLREAYLERADLRHANLRDANLTSANLGGTKLWAADLKDAKLQRANLRQADLGDANLTGAELTGAELTAANLGGANLNGANLVHADLGDANLEGAKLSDADLTGVELGYTSFVAVDLRQVQGLESVKHSRPSHVSTSTLTKSQGKIPEAFLRGCGLTDWEIENAKLYDPALSRDERTLISYEIVNLQAESPIMLHHLFISYNRKDEKFIEKVEKGRDETHIRYWRDVHDLKAGRLETQIDKAIRMNPIVLLVLSERSVESDWVEWEVSKARELEKAEKRDVLCPLALDESWKTCDWPGPLRRQIMDYNILDFSEDAAFDEQFEKLVRGIVEFYPSPARTRSGR